MLIGGGLRGGCEGGAEVDAWARFVITRLSGRAADACLELVDRREDALYAGPSAGTTL